MRAEDDSWHELVSNNNTTSVPVGSHVKIDLSTGQKWIRKDDDTTTTTSSSTTTSTASHSRAVVASEPKEATKNDDSYDYDMMYRTLSQIEELNDVLPAYVNSNAQEQRTQFQQSLLNLWQQRQATLQQLSIADLPQVLKDHIQALQQQNDDSNTIWVLQELEYLLQDIDMARDFHTLGGWTVLQSLLSKDKDDLQGHVAWVMGTAIGNIEEFHSYALEQEAGKNTIDLLMNHLHQAPTQYKKNDTQQEQQEMYLSFTIPKLLYGLGACLRGNPHAQTYWMEEHSYHRTFRALLSLPHVKITRKVTDLLYDLITEQRQQQSNQEEKKSSSPLLSPELCAAIVPNHNPEDTTSSSILWLRQECQSTTNVEKEL